MKPSNLEELRESFTVNSLRVWFGHICKTTALFR